MVAEHGSKLCLQKGNIEDAGVDAQGRPFKRGDDDVRTLNDNEFSDKSQQAFDDKTKKWFDNKFEDDDKSLEVFVDKVNEWFKGHAGDVIFGKPNSTSAANTDELTSTVRAKNITGAPDKNNEKQTQQ